MRRLRRLSVALQAVLTGEEKKQIEEELEPEAAPLLASPAVELPDFLAGSSYQAPEPKPEPEPEPEAASPKEGRFKRGLRRLSVSLSFSFQF